MVAKRWKWHKYPPRDEWTNKASSMHTKDDYWTLKGNTALTPATTWVSLKNTTLRESSQTQKGNNT